MLPPRCEGDLSSTGILTRHELLLTYVSGQPISSFFLTLEDAIVFKLCRRERH